MLETMEHDTGAIENEGIAPEINETEAKARRMGWVPKDEFRGDPDRWRPADEFVERGTNMLPIVQEQYRRLDSRYAEMEKRFADSQQALIDLTERARKADERAYQRAMRDIEAKRQAAVASADTEAFREAEREMRELQDGQGVAVREKPQQTRAQAPQPPEPRAPTQQEGPAPEVLAFIRENPWFESDHDAQQDATAIATAMRQREPSRPLSEVLAATRDKMKRLRPELFENARRAAPASVTPSSGETRRPANPRSFENLPAEVRKEYDRYSRVLAGKGKPLTKEEWAGYYWENEA